MFCAKLMFRHINIQGIHLLTLYHRKAKTMSDKTDQHAVLAHLDGQKNITLCQHGIVHLNWGMSTWRFRPRGLAHIFQVLERGSQLQQGQEFCDGPVCVSHIEDGKFTLNVMDYGLSFNAESLHLFRDLLYNALRQLGYEPVTEPNFPAARATHFMAKKYQPKGFSLN